MTKLKEQWTTYFILDSIQQFNFIPKFPIYNQKTLVELIDSLQLEGLLDDQLTLTDSGKRVRKKLYKELGLNKHTAHIYPKIDDIL